MTMTQKQILKSERELELKGYKEFLRVNEKQELIRLRIDLEALKKHVSLLEQKVRNINNEF